MSTSRVNQTFYLVVLAVTLSCVVIIPFGACEASPSANDAPFPHDGSNSTTKDHSSESEHGINIFFQFVTYGFSSVFWLFSFVLSPIIYLLGLLYTIFCYTPTVFVWKIISLFSPLLAFCSAAALFGICIGATAGWFSEIIIGVLNSPSEDGLALAELENKKRMAKLRRRAAAIANLKARNGGRIPEEFYRRQGNNPRKNILQNGMFDGYGSDYRKDYSVRRE